MPAQPLQAESNVTKLRNLAQLIDVASRVLGEKGAESLSLDDIAAELGMHRSSLYYYVANKAELLDLVERHRQELIADEIDRIAASDAQPRAKLAAAIRAHLQHMDRYFPESKSWNRLDPNPHPAVAPLDSGALRNRAIVDRFAGILEAGMASGDFAGVGEPKLLALAILGMCNWAPRWYRKGGRLSIDQISELFSALVEAGLTPRAAKRAEATRP